MINSTLMSSHKLISMSSRSLLSFLDSIPNIGLLLDDSFYELGRVKIDILMAISTRFVHVKRTLAAFKPVHR